MSTQSYFKDLQQLKYRDEINLVSACLKSQWLGFGKQVKEFEKNFSKKFNLLSKTSFFVEETA